MDTAQIWLHLVDYQEIKNQDIIEATPLYSMTFKNALISFLPCPAQAQELNNKIIWIYIVLGKTSDQLQQISSSDTKLAL